MDKKLLRETYQIDNLVRKPLNIQEGVELKEYGFVYEKVPVWRLDIENLNGRIYTTSLAEQIVAQNAVTNVLRNHIDDFDAEILDIKAIAKNPVVEDGFLKVDLQMVDENFATLIENIVEAGGKVGLSSVGYGYVNEDKEVEDYTLVRYADFVINPSALVFIEDHKNEEEVQEEEQDIQPELETSNEGEETAVSAEVISPEELEDIRNRFEVKKNGKH